MRAPVRAGALISSLLFAAAAFSVSLAQVRPPDAGPFPKPHPVRTLMPMPTLAPPPGVPGATATPSAADGGAQRLNGSPLRTGRGVWRPGRHVPLGALPPLPAQSSANTAVFDKNGHMLRRPMAANGATIVYFADVFSSACASVVGTLIPVGCDVYWYSNNLPGSDTWDDYYIPAGSQTAIEASGGTYTGTGGPFNDTPAMTSTGTYVLATFDVTKNQWESVVYVTVGNVNVFGTYADSAATVAQQQFTAASGTNVYINATGLTQGQYYVAYVESTSGKTYCAYIAPPGSATPNPNGLCDPTTSAGIVAVVGAQSSAAITAVWPLSSTTPTGTYSVVLYNKTTGQRLAMRQVSITKSGSSGAISLVPTAGNAALPANWPTMPPAQGASTKFAFDSTTEQSDKSWTMTASGLSASKSYTFTVTDPTGAVVSGPTSITTSSSGSATRTWTFGNTQSPSNYIANTYTVQMMNSSGTVDASQAFQILGYNAVTQFKDPNNGVISTAIVLPQSASVLTTLQFTNDGDTYYGSGNGDTLRGIAFNTGSVGIWINLTDPSVTSCGSTCQQQSVTDSSGQTWTVQNTCYGGNGANKGCTLTAYPATSGNVLAMNGVIAIPNVQFNNVPGNSNCQSGCSGLTAILPTDGASWSNDNNSSSTNAVYFTNGAGNTWAGTASVTHIGYRDSGNAYYAGKETHGYTTNGTNAIYSANSPYTTPSNYSDVWSIGLTNNSSLGTANMTQIEVVLPTAYSPSGTQTYWAIDSGSPTQWTQSTCPGGSPASAICLKASGSNAGIAPSASETLYLDLTPPPPGAFSYTDWTLQAIVPTQFQMTPSGTFSGFVPSTSSYDTTATATYSLNGNLITPAFSPTSAGQNTNNAMSINVTNASTAQDPFPDYLDAIAIDLPSTNGFTNVAGMPAGWSLLGTSTPAAGTTRYWFGLCAAQFNTADGPVSNPPPVNPTLPSCGSATEANSIAPGATFTASGNLQTSTGNITGTMYAHGANGGGWSQAHTFTLSVTSVAAAAGFSAAGGYPSGNTVASPNTPQIGADSDVTYGNVFTYVIKNTSGSSQYLTSAVITIPGLDVSSVLPADGSAWTLTNTPAISGSAYGCSITGSASANRTGTNNGYGAYNGGITIGGASCKIPSGSSITVTFDAKAPYTVNDSYQFPTTVNGSVQAAEQWQTDTIVQIILSATLSISVNPGNPGPGGSAPVVNCPVCLFNTGTNTVDFGPVANLQTVTGGDVVRVSVYTNAGANNGWKLYVSTNSNPANTGTPTNELLTSIDSSHSAPTSGINFDQTAYGVVPTTSPGMLLMDTGSGHAAQRAPFDEIMNYEVSIQGGSTAPNTSTVTYTFISN